METLGEFNPKLQKLYAALGEQAAALSAQAGNASADSLGRILDAFDIDIRHAN
jgi:hypothetical protein